MNTKNKFVVSPIVATFALIPIAGFSAIFAEVFFELTQEDNRFGIVGRAANTAIFATIVQSTYLIIWLSTL